jgi:enterochelin esterase family protein
MPKFISSPYLVEKNVPRGRIDSFRVFQKNGIIKPRTIKVYTPANYSMLSKLPSVYVHDGNDAIAFAKFTVILDNLIEEKKIQPVIAVFIPPIERSEEYLFPKREQFINAVTNEIVPLIDSLYKTERSPKSRAVMGISNGGHISLSIAISRPDIFSKVAGQSSTISPMLIEAAQKNSLPPLTMYLDCGVYDIDRIDPQYGRVIFLEKNRVFHRSLLAIKYPHIYKEFNDGHEWANWRERMPEILQLFFEK